MKIGCLGDIIFEVSDSMILTFESANWNGSVSIGSHDRHLDNPLQEFVSIGADEFSFTFTLSKHLGVNPMEVIEKLLYYERNGITLPLFIGDRQYGKYRWLIKNHKIKMKTFDGRGNLVSADVSISLIEYTEG